MIGVLLRRLKCRMVGHAWDRDMPEGRSQPGYWWCARCRRYCPSKGDLNLYHLAILKKAGWTDAEILRHEFQAVPMDAVMLFLRSVNHLDPETREERLKAYQDGYVAGYYAGQKS